MKKTIILVLSIAINLVMLYILIKQNHKLNRQEIDKVNAIQSKMDYSVTSIQNFEAVFINQNDSIYKQLWNESFMNNSPQQTFVISCAYYYVTKKQSVLHDIELSNLDIKRTYNKGVLIKETSTIK